MKPGKAAHRVGSIGVLIMVFAFAVAAIGIWTDWRVFATACLIFVFGAFVVGFGALIYIGENS